MCPSESSKNLAFFVRFSVSSRTFLGEASFFPTGAFWLAGRVLFSRACPRFFSSDVKKSMIESNSPFSSSGDCTRGGLMPSMLCAKCLEEDSARERATAPSFSASAAYSGVGKRPVNRNVMRIIWSRPFLIHFPFIPYSPLPWYDYSLNHHKNIIRQ